MDVPADLEERINGVAALDQPLRRALYELLADRDDWTSRDEAAEALGVARTVAAFHLDKLAEVGVLAVRFERTSGRTGPGAGRPAKLYRRVAAEVTATVPDRHYDLAASLLAAAVAESTASGTPIADCVQAVARTAGREVGAGVEGGAEDVVDLLARYGYEPRPEGRSVALANCPFHRLAQDHRELVCGMNRDFLAGVLEAADPDGDRAAHLEARPGWCCVRLRPD